MLHATHETAPAVIGQWLESVLERTREFTREHPDQALLWAAGVGFVLGWKLKPW
jgi:ElaB/YqjD/DUF883 family membrane-anchored ribosome-binding protein